jgi:hypothetical protein
MQSASCCQRRPHGDRVCWMSENESAYVVFVWTSSGYELRERSGDPPALGSQVEEDGRTLVVSKVGSSPLPGDHRTCVFLEGVAGG